MSLSVLGDDDMLEVYSLIDGYPGWHRMARVDVRAEPFRIIEWTVRRGNPILDELERRGKVRYSGPPVRIAPGITADLLQAASRMSSTIEEVNRHLAGHGIGTKLPDPRKARARTDEYYVAVAAQYADLIRKGSTQPNLELAEQLGLQRSQVRDLIVQCRNRGLLTKGAQGKPGGQLTDRAVELLTSGLPDHRLGGVAKAYRRAVEDGTATLAAVADELGGTSQRTASRWVARAREAGLLDEDPPAAARPAKRTRKGR